jgi:hypothetical protein
MWCHWCHTLTIRGPDSAKDWNPDAMEDALRAISYGSLDYLELLFGDAMLTVAGVLRGLFIAAEGCELVSSDFTAIEGVVIACLAGEQWRIDAFAQDRSLYVESASRAFGVPVEEMERHKVETGQHHPLRQVGKGLELACLAPDVEVLTDRGYVPIAQVTLEHKLWDGIAWVTHQGLVYKGVKPVVSLDGMRMTPNHLVRCNGSWLEASRLASSASILSQALVTGLASYSFYALWQKSLVTPASWSLALVGRPRTEFHLPTYEKGHPLGAGLARSKSQEKPARCFGSTPNTAPTTSTGAGFSIGLLRRSGDVTAQLTPNTQTTGAEASLCARSGEKTVAVLFNTWSRFRVGMTRAWKWIAKTTTEVTSRATFSSSASETTCSIGEPSPSCNAESMNLSDVYDIAHAGPRNRFTIRTNRGHLVVHNCGYAGWIGAVKAFGMEGTDEELKKNVLAWRKASPAIEEFWGGQKGGPGAFDRWQPRMFGLEGAAVQAVMNPNEVFHVRRLDGNLTGISYVKHGSVLYCHCPGGVITYHRPRLRQAEQEWRGLSLSFEGWNSNPKSGPMGWIRMDTYGGKLAENCIAAGTLVLTRKGWAPIETIEPGTEVHDGEEFVHHDGLAVKGAQPCISIDGVWMTPDHEVLTNDGWCEAQKNPRLYRPAIRHADGRVFSWVLRPESALDGEVRMRWKQGLPDPGVEEGCEARQVEQLRVHYQILTGAGENHPRNDPSSSVRSVAIDDRSVSTPNPSSLEKLWSARHYGVHQVVRIFRELLVRHGGNIRQGFRFGSTRQRGWVFAGELPVGYAQKECAEQKDQHDNTHPRGPDAYLRSCRGVGGESKHVTLEGSKGVARGETIRRPQVMDLVNCGPRNRFMVLGGEGPFIVHNCTQHVARNIQMNAIRRCEQSGRYPVVMHTYDEIVAEVRIGEGSVEELEGMMTTPAPWHEGWPIKAAGGWRGARYRKG